VLGVVINADVLTSDLLKTSKASQVFSVFGKPDVRLHQQGEEYTVEVRGVDIYDPNTGEFDPSNQDQIAAWFLDTDYNTHTFLVCQAYFPSQSPNPWEKLGKALKGTIDEAQIAALQRTTSLPFKPVQHQRCAVKVIDHRGNEVMTVLKVG
jgi:adenine-specific DNA-methyltransferase